MRAPLPVLMMLAMLGGCYRVTYINGPTYDPEPATDEWHNIGIFSLVEFSAPVPLSQICPQGFGRIEQEESLVNAITRIVVGGVFYSPRTVRVYCKAGSAYRLDLDRNGDAIRAEPLPEVAVR